MERFIDLPVSVFDPGCTLNPFDYLEALYPGKSIPASAPSCAITTLKRENQRKHAGF